jgi:HPt (histidine-containing phosphotransfer) domain-containing protein
MPETSSTREDAAVRLDEAEILARLDGDCQLLAELCDMLLVELPRMMDTLIEAIRIEDANAVHRAAHRLKGSLSVFGEGAHIEDCVSLEEMAMKQDLARAPEVLSSMQGHLEEFRVAVASLGKECHARADRR